MKPDFIITDHAIERFKERVGGSDPQEIREEIRYRIKNSDIKNLARLKKGIKKSKRTIHILTDGCIFIFNGRKLVTCLDKFRNAAEPEPR